MTAATIRYWYLVHKWTSLLCTAFLLMLCVTGLPLIFHDEIDQLGAAEQVELRRDLPSSADLPGLLPLDRMLAHALADRPGAVPLFMAFDNRSSQMTVTTAPTLAAAPADMTIQLLDRATGQSLGPVREEGIMSVLLALHVDMFLGLPGMLFLGAMGLLFIIAILSGVVLYAPFMRRLRFGTVRTGRSRRLAWLDVHNLLGIVTLVWASVVGLTGVINTLAEPIADSWRTATLAAMTRGEAGLPLIPVDQRVSIDAALRQARSALPGLRPQFIAFPGSAFSTPHHYAVFFQGDRPLTERMLTPALIDAGTGRLTDVRPMPLATKALQMSQPLHFGDYGGLPLKILWALLDIVTILVLASGLVLWIRRWHRPAPAWSSDPAIESVVA